MTPRLRPLLLACLLATTAGCALTEIPLPRPGVPLPDDPGFRPISRQDCETRGGRWTGSMSMRTESYACAWERPSKR